MGAGDPFFAIWKILGIQAGVSIVVPAFMLVFFGWGEARSSFIGGLAALIPNALFAMRVTAAKGKAAREIVGSFYSGELIKIIVTAGLFILVFQIPDIIYIPLFTGFIAVIFVFWFALFFSRTTGH